MTALVLTGALAGGAGGLVNLLLWWRTLRHTRIFGIPLHRGFAHTIGGALAEIPEHLDKKNIKHIEQQILEVFDTFMAERLTQKMPVLSMFMDEKLIAEIRIIFRHEMEEHLPKVLMSNFTAEKNIIMVSSLLMKAVAKGLKKYTWHAVAYLFLGALAGAVTGYIVAIVCN